MALHLRTVLMSYLLLISLMKDAKPVLAEEQTLRKTVIEKFEEYMKNVEQRLKALEKFHTSGVAGLEDSEILNNGASFLKALGDFLKPVTQSDTQWKRCWRASQDGWAASTFHSLCDGKGPTVTIVRVDHKYIFGGYTSLSWDAGSCTYQYDSAAFLFSLVNKPGWQPVKLDQLTGLLSSSSIYSCSSYLPTFGGGHDLFIADLASSNTANSDSDLGYTFAPPTGYSYGSDFTNSFLAGSRFFQPDEVEVFYKTT